MGLPAEATPEKARPMHDFAAADHLSREEILALQTALLPEAVARAARSPHYARALPAAGISPRRHPLPR